MADYVDYDYVPETGGGNFLTLKKKDDKVTIRLVEKALAYFVHWVENKNSICDDPDHCDICNRLKALSVEEQKKEINAKQRRRQTFIWPVIDRADGQAKIYKAGINVFLEIAELAKNPKWGGADKDATKFDIEITRTEASLQNFYSVVPDPTSLNMAITEDEKAKIAKIMPLIDSITTKKEVISDEEAQRIADAIDDKKKD